MIFLYKKSKIFILVIFLVFVFGFFPVGNFFVYADNAICNVDVINETPTASSVSIDGGALEVNLTENTTTAVTITATVTDNNGCEDIDAVSVMFYKTSVGSTSPDDANDHYTTTATRDGGSCTVGGADLTATYTATINVYYYADPTDENSISSTTNWTAMVTPSDDDNGTYATSAIEIATLTALNVTSSISYGELALNANTGTTDATTTITNTGNEGIDVRVDGYGAIDGDGYSMACEIGNISIENEKYATSTGVDYSSKTALSDTAFEIDMDIAQQTSSTSTVNIYWGIGMPVSGVGGTCSGVIVFTAWSDPYLD